MTPRAPFPCRKTEAVLSLLLDGDLVDRDPIDGGAVDGDGYTFVRGETLQAHLRDCDVCQTLLRRARRLDAALAHAAGADHAAHVHAGGEAMALRQARWFTTAIGSATAALASAGPTAPVASSEAAGRAHAGRAGGRPAPTGEPMRAATARPPRWAGVALAGAAFALVVPWVVGPGEPRGTSASIAAADAPAASAGAPQPLAANTAPPRTTAWPRRPHRPPVRAEQPVPTAAQWRQRLADAGAPAHERLAAAQALLDASDGTSTRSDAAHRALLDAVARCGDGDAASGLVHARTIGLLHDAQHFVGNLRDDLRALARPQHRRDGLDPAALAAVTVATWLHVDELDGALRHLARRRPDAAPAIAAALRCGVRPVGGGRLLLHLWLDRSVRSDDASADAPLAWFDGQPAPLFAELASELQASRVAARRRACLLALGGATDGAVVPVLLERIRSTHHGEAHAAAFALSRLPLPLLDELVVAARGSYLLRAALARAGHVAAAGWVAALRLDAAERQQLRAGSLVTFPATASWFRTRDSAPERAP